MPQADWIISNATIVSMDEEGRILKDGAIAVAGETLVAVGDRRDVLAEFDAAEHLDAGGKTLIPGLVNAHTHVP